MELAEVKAEFEVAQELLQKAATEPNVYKRQAQLNLAQVAIDKVRKHVDEQTANPTPEKLGTAFNMRLKLNALEDEGMTISRTMDAIRQMVGRAMIDSGRAYGKT